MSYASVMSRRAEILEKSTGFDYSKFKLGKLAFDYEAMMAATGYSLDEVREVQGRAHVGRTPLLELENLTRLVRRFAPAGKGARIFLKDEAANPSGSFKDRRASLSVHQAARAGYRGVVAATSGNYGAAVASQAAKCNLDCIILQETYDSRGAGQPEIVEKGRKCEALGAEVIQLTVGPELFYYLLVVLEETGYFNASLYTPFSVAGIETLGAEIAEETVERTGSAPDAVVVTHAGGGNLTGTARGLKKAGCPGTKVIAASINISGLHMASDGDFNRKSCTTGHTGFGVPFATWPDRSDVPYNAARALRYMDRYVTVTQGEVFYATEALACLEGMERGPAGNASLAASLALAREMDADQVIVVQETEYTGAGKHHAAQLFFARENGVEVRLGDPREEVPGQSIVLPQRFEQLHVEDLNLDDLRRSYIRNAVKKVTPSLAEEDLDFIAEDIGADRHFVDRTVAEIKAGGVA
jgi:2-amino-4-ketopentanoate thiolase beta subunit